VLHAARWKCRKKPVKHQCLPHISSQYGELQPNGRDVLASLGHPSTLQRVSRLITFAKEDMQSLLLFVCLSFCLLATMRKNSQTDLHEIFREGWQWAHQQTVKFWWRSGSRIRTDPDAHHNTGKTCLGGGMHCPSALV